MQTQRISQTDLLTPSEHALSGSTPGVEPQNERAWHMPVGVLTGKITVEDARSARREKGSLPMTIAAPMLQVRGKEIVLGFADLDSEGKAMENPWLGEKVVDPETHVATVVRNQEWTERYYQICQEYKIDLHLQEMPSAAEGQRVHPPEAPQGNSPERG